MTLELQVSPNPAPLVLPISGSPPKPKARKRQPRFDCPFQYGEVIQPDHDQIGGYLHESGRRQLCLDLEVHERVVQHVGNAWQGKWKMGVWMYSRLQPREVHRVVSTKFGWRVQRRIPERASFHNLGHSLCGDPVLFASPNVAIAATEMLIGDPPDEFWFFTWLRP